MSDKPKTKTVEIPDELYHDFLRWRIMKGCLDTPSDSGYDLAEVEFHSTDAPANQTPSPEFELHPEPTIKTPGFEAYCRKPDMNLDSAKARMEVADEFYKKPMVKPEKRMVESTDDELEQEKAFFGSKQGTEYVPAPKVEVHMSDLDKAYNFANGLAEFITLDDDEYTMMVVEKLKHDRYNKK
jgi:hypothetical protein